METAAFRPTWISTRSSWVNFLPLSFWLVGRLRPTTLVELGTSGGNSYMSMCQAVRDWGLATRCYAVDTWKGDAHSGLYPESVYQKLSEYNRFCYRDFSTLMRCTFDQALDSFADQSIDLLHIDGYHTYQAARHDFDTWLPKVAPGGVVMLHDIDVHRKDFGVYQLWNELVEQFPHTLRIPGRAGLGLIQLPHTQQDKPSILPPANSYQAHLLVRWLRSLGEVEWERQAKIRDQTRKKNQPPPTLPSPQPTPPPRSLASRLLPRYTWPGQLARSIYRQFRPLAVAPIPTQATPHHPPPQVSSPLLPDADLPNIPQNHPPLHHYYHVYADGHWKPILIEHLATLEQSGLIDRLTTLRIGCVGHPENRRRVWRWLEALGFQFEVVAEADTGYEQVTLQPLHRFSLVNQGWVLYAHTKGAHNDNVFNHRWRRTMAHHVVTRWPAAVAHLDSCDAVGCHWLTFNEFNAFPDTPFPFFGGNFWWANLSYLSRLGPPATTTRHLAESWIGQDPLIRIHDLNPGWPDQKIFVPVPPFNGDGAP